MTWHSRTLSLVLFAALLLLAFPAQPQSSGPVPLLGLIVVPSTKDESGVRVVAVLERSPAQRAQVLEGDRLERLGDVAITTPQELDRALARRRPGETVDLHVARDGNTLRLQAQLADQMASRGTVLRGRNRGTTGFESPGWYAYAWANVAENTEPPTAQNTTGKVVVIHSFQSW